MEASELLLQSAIPFDKACLLVREMELKIERLQDLVVVLKPFITHNHDGIDCPGCALDKRIELVLLK